MPSEVDAPLLPTSPSHPPPPPPPTRSFFLRRPYLLASILLITLLASTGFHRPTPSSSGFIFPGLLPSSLSRLYSTSSNVVYTSPNLRREQERRYAHLRHPRIPGSDRISNITEAKYLFVTLTRDIEAQLPDLLNTLVVLTSFLGPNRVRFSIYEGPSSDSTPTVFRETLLPILKKLGVADSDIALETDRPEVDFSTRNRIQALADLRNEALAPLWTKGWGESTAAIVYFNDVYLRARDVLELLHQHVRAGEVDGRETGLTSGLDWWSRHPQYYYDIWVARTMQGDLFYPVTETFWQPSDKFLVSSPSSLEAYEHLRPFQAFSSWAGMAVLSATPFLPPHNLRFRRGREGECAASECELVCRDLWELGFGRIQVVPSVQLGYSRDVALDIVQTMKPIMDYQNWYEETPNEHDDNHVRWNNDPPSQVKCHPWPEKNGLDGNVWEKVEWGPPYIGFGA